MKRYEPRTARTRFLYARRYWPALSRRDLAEVSLLSPGKRGHVLKSLAAISKFLGIYEEFQGLIKSYGLKWSEGGGDTYILKRLTKRVDPVFPSWVREVKRQIPEFAPFLDLLILTGLRFEEGIKAWNLIIELNQQKKLDEYYDSENQVLKHFKFGEIFMRGRKKCFISFVPEELIREIINHGRITRDIIYCKLKRRKLRILFSEIREYYASMMTKYLREPEINLLQGRVSNSVFMQHYFNPIWISDLRARAIEGGLSLLEHLQQENNQKIAFFNRVVSI